MLELTNQQEMDFEEEGFLVVENLFDESTVDELRDRFDRLFRGDFETGISPDEVNWQEATGDPSLTRQICNGWRADRTIARAVTRKILAKQLPPSGSGQGLE